MFGRKTNRDIELEIDGMSCGHWRQAVEDALADVEGVVSVDVSLDEASATVATDEDTDASTLVAAVTEAGYEARAE